MASFCQPRAQTHDDATTPARGRGAAHPTRRGWPSSASLRPVAGLSTASLERKLGLPAGAKRRRRLFALRVASGGLAEMGICRGDLLIVEPGQRANCDHLVVVGHGRSLSLRRVVTENGHARRRVLVSPEPHSLPLATPIIPREVVGTVIGLIARRGQAPGETTAPGAADDSHLAISAPARALNRRRLRATMSAWDRWTRCQAAPIKDRPNRYRAMLAGRLRILASCMEVAKDDALYRALVAEANRVIAAMRQESARSQGPSLLALRPPSAPRIAALRRDLSGNPQTAHNQRPLSA